MCFLGVLAQPALSLLIKVVTSPSDPNLTLRENELGKRYLMLGSEEVTMARLIQFYVPQNFKPPKRQRGPLEQRGKIIEFQSAAIRKSA